MSTHTKVYMFIATLAFVTHVTGVILSILYTPTCREIRGAWSTKLNLYGDQRSLDPSVDSESFVLFETSRCITQTLDQAGSGARHPKIICRVWRQQWCLIGLLYLCVTTNYQ